MSQRTQGSRWAALVSALLVLFAAQAGLVGCAIITGTETAPQVLTEGRGLGGDESIVVHMQTITAGRELVGGAATPEWLVGSKEIRLMRPMAVGALGKDLYIVDMGLESIFRYDLSRMGLRSIVNIRGHFQAEPGGIYVARDGSFYVTDPFGRRVLYFSHTGQLLRTFQDPTNLARPVDVVVDEATGNLFVTDSVFSRVIVFNALGLPLYVIGSRGTGDTPGTFVSPSALALKGRDSLYVTDPVGIPAQLIGIDSTAVFTFGKGALSNPSSIVEDSYGRVYVSDIEDDMIKVFFDGELIGRIGGRGLGPGEFREIRDMWISEEHLYVADTLNGRVQVFRIVPPPPGAAGAQ